VAKYHKYIFNIEKRRLVGEFEAIYAAEEGNGFVAEVLYRRYEQAFLYNGASVGLGRHFCPGGGLGSRTIGSENAKLR
jgi:hypothetical protein